MLGEKEENILIYLIKKYNVRIMAEIGIWKSYTLKSILKSDCNKVLQEYWAVDQWKVLGPEHLHMGRVTQEEWDGLYYNSCSCMPFFKQLRVLKLNSEKASLLFNNRFFPGGYFDLVFLDASHFYEDVLRDIKLWVPLIKKGGIISGHDYKINTKKNHRVKTAVDEYFGNTNVTVINNCWYKIL